MAHGACHHCGCAFEECECGVTVSAPREPFDPAVLEAVDYGTLEMRVLATIEWTPEGMNQPVAGFDYILLDVPCRSAGQQPETAPWPYEDWVWPYEDCL